MEESRHSGSRTTGPTGLGGVGRRENGAGGRPGPAGRVQGGHGHRAAVRHARAPAEGPPVPAGHPVSPDDYFRKRQHNDDFQRHQVGRE